MHTSNRLIFAHFSVELFRFLNVVPLKITAMGGGGVGVGSNGKVSMGN